jgi:HlyD family secretion protein
MNETLDAVPLDLANVPAATSPPTPPVAARPKKVGHDSAVIDQDLRERVRQLRIGGPSEGKSSSKGSFVGRVAWLPWLLCIGMAILWASYAIRFYKTPANTSNDIVTTGEAKAVTGTSSVNTSGKPAGNGAAEEKVVVLENRGYLILPKQITVSPIDVGGKLVKLYGPAGQNVLPFGEGALYKEGDIIAELDATSYKAQLDEAKASLVAAEKATIASRQRLKEQLPESVRKVEKEQLQAEIDESKASLLRADQELTRQESLRNSGNSVSLKEYQQSVADKASAKSRVDKLTATLSILELGPRPEKLRSLEADVAQAEANEQAAKARLAQAEWRTTNCIIRAPITGTVLSKKAEVGNLVNPMAFAGGGGGICDLGDLTDMEMECEIAERDISKLSAGQPCRIRVDAYGDRQYTGVLDRIYPVAARSNNTVKVRVKVKLQADELPGQYLKPDMGGVVTFLPMKK